MKTFKLIIAILIFVTFLISCGTVKNNDLNYPEIDPAYYDTQFPESALIYNYKDANKVLDGSDDNLCWLYTAANLDANYNNNDADEVADYLKSYFDNQAGWISTALEFLGYSDIIGVEADRDHIIDFVKFCINNERAVALRLYEDDIMYGHLITVFGYEQQEDSIYLHIVESSDKVKELRKVNLIDNRFTNPDHAMFNIDYGLALINDLL